MGVIITYVFEDVNTNVIRRDAAREIIFIDYLKLIASNKNRL
jgi:hypothetical protein